MKIFFSLILFAFTIPVYAQTAPSDAGKGRARFDCSQAKDPKACEERREKMKAAFGQARKACEGKKGPERRDCMTQQMCAQAKDPAQCEARARQRAENRKK